MRVQLHFQGVQTRPGQLGFQLRGLHFELGRALSALLEPALVIHRVGDRNDAQVVGEIPVHLKEEGAAVRAVGGWPVDDGPQQKVDGHIQHVEGEEQNHMERQANRPLLPGEPEAPREPYQHRGERRPDPAHGQANLDDDLAIARRNE